MLGQVVLTAFKKLLRAGSEAEILKALADAAVTTVGARGAAIVQVQANGEAKVVEGRNLPERIASHCTDIDVIDVELGDRLLRACARAETSGDAVRFTHARTFAMASDGDLFGALVIFFAEGSAATPQAMATAEAFCDLAAITLGKARQYDELSRSYAELRASREVLERTEKLRALGEMAAGISHDLKNILNPLSLHLQLLKRVLRRASHDAETAKSTAEAIAEMEHVLHRGVETIERLRDFSRQAPERRMERVELDLIAHEALELARPRIAAVRRPRGIRLVEELGGPPPILAHSAGLVSAILNLLVNGIDAMTEGGSLTISTGAADGGAWVRVRDEGPGIPDDVKERIFEPFFTTKGKEGTGLGLAMVYAFVQRHGGKLTLDTAPGRGTTFTLWFPVSSGA
jgi:signal transduction histidine kinase